MPGNGTKLVRVRAYAWAPILSVTKWKHAHTCTHTCTHEMGRDLPATVIFFTLETNYDFKIHQWVTMNRFIVRIPGLTQQQMENGLSYGHSPTFLLDWKRFQIITIHV